MADHRTRFGQERPWILNGIFSTRLISLMDSRYFWYNMQAHSEILLLILVQLTCLNFTSWEKLTGFYSLAKHLQILKNTNADSPHPISKQCIKLRLDRNSSIKIKQAPDRAWVGKINLFKPRWWLIKKALNGADEPGQYIRSLGILEGTSKERENKGKSNKGQEDKKGSH